MNFTGERIVWENPADHLKEFQQCSNYYMEAMHHAKGKRVVDAACGTGFGSFLLSLVAEKVFALDKYDMWGQWRPFEVMTPNPITFMQIDFEQAPVDITADLAISIETIEHLANPDFFLNNLKAKSLFFTIPCYGNKNEFHKKEYDENTAKQLIMKHYPLLDYRMEHKRMIGLAHRAV